MDGAAVALLYQKRLLAKVHARRDAAALASGTFLSAAASNSDLQSPPSSVSARLQSPGTNLCVRSRTLRRQSLGGFDVLDASDVQQALAKIAFAVASPRESRFPSSTPPSGTLGGNTAKQSLRSHLAVENVKPDTSVATTEPESGRDAITASATRVHSDSMVACYWRTGRQLDITEWLRSPAGLATGALRTTVSARVCGKAMGERRSIRCSSDA